MATFEEFRQSIDAEGNDGKVFEDFCKWFLENIYEIHPADDNGLTPYRVAEMNAFEEIMKLFEQTTFLYIPTSAITRPHLPPGFWRIGKPL